MTITGNLYLEELRNMPSKIFPCLAKASQETFNCRLPVIHYIGGRIRLFRISKDYAKWLLVIKPKNVLLG